MASFIFFIFTLPFGFFTMCSADIITDGTTGQAQSLSGPDFTIPESLGTLSGQNLFHSFQTFSIAETQSAIFTGSDSINNVISRVTGGEASHIDGLLRSEIGKADFFFINPSGVMFGPHAKVDVPASFHVSTAQELIFDDGSRFSSVSSEKSTLTQAKPEAFGFLGPQAANIEINGSVLEFTPESTVTLSGGDITIQRDHQNSNEESKNRASLACERGKIQLTAMGDNNATLLIDSSISSDSPKSLSTDAVGNLLLDAAVVNVSGNGNGKIAIQAGNALICGNSFIVSDNTGDLHSDANRGIQIQVNNRFEIVDGAVISSSTWTNGDAGNVSINTAELTIDDQGNDSFTGIISNAKSDSQGNAGSVDITVDGLLKLLNGAQILSSTWAKGDAGKVSINAVELTIDDEINSESLTGITSNANPGSEGNAGTVDITVSGLLQLLNGTQISSTTFAQGDAGKVSINANELTIDGQGSDYSTGIASLATPDSEGHGGTVDITVNGLLKLIDGATISSSTWAQGDAGNISINANTLTIDGQNSEYSTGIASTAESGSEGDAGSVDIIVGELLKLINDAVILTSTSAQGDAGDLSINTAELTMDGQGSESGIGIASSAYTGSEGDAGTVTITVNGLLQLLGGPVEISSSTFAQGNAENVSINAAELIIDNQVSGVFTGITSNAYSSSEGNAGTVAITVNGLLQLLGTAEISSSTWAQGDAGNVSIDASDIFMESSGIYCAATNNPSGNVGNIIINSNSTTLIDHSEIAIFAMQYLSEEKLSEDSHHSIQIYSNTLYLDQDSKISAESTGNATASNIEIQSERFITKGDSSITTSAEKADGGDITIQGNAIILNDAQISTSVKSSGDGGDITITGMTDGETDNHLAMKHGFIQANTEEQGASGGNIILEIDGMIIDKSGNGLIVDDPIRRNYGDDPRLSVIQAAAEAGTKGNIETHNAPELDISGAIANMDTQFISQAALTTDPCISELSRRKPSTLISDDSALVSPITGSCSTISLNQDRLERIFHQGNDI